jgi:hypothetical protein
MSRSGMSINFDLHPQINVVNGTTEYHPSNKEDFANRFSPWALRLVYGHTTAALSQTGPLYRSYDVGNGSVTVHFDLPNGTGLPLSPSLTGFQIASAVPPIICGRPRR